MSVHDLETQLSECMGSNSDTTKDAAHQAMQYTDMFKAGKITKEEYVELMEDVKHSANINQAMDDMQYLQNLNLAINGLVNLASAV